MRKLIIIAAVIFSAFSFSGCGSNSSDSKDKNANLANTDINIVESSEGDEDSSLPDKTSFNKIPDEAVDSFNFMVEATKKIYIQESSKRLYGYIGTESVNETDCYLFDLYDVQDDKNEKVAAVAVSTDAEKIFVFNERSQEYNELEIPEDSSSQEESQWSDSITASFSDYFNGSSDKNESSVCELTDESIVESVKN